MAQTAQQITSEIAQLQDRLRTARNGLANLDRNLQSNQALVVRYTQEVAAIPGQVLALQAQLKSVLPPASAGDIVNNANRARDENANAKLPSSGPELLAPTGRIDPAGSGAGTNATPTPTIKSNPTVGTDATVRTTAETQAMINNTRGQLIVSEDGTVSNLRRNPEDGSLYDPGPNAAPVAGPGAGSSEDSVTDQGEIIITANRPPRKQLNQSYVYQAVSVVSSFKQGKFEQSLKGILYTQQTKNTTQTNAQQREPAKTAPAIVKTDTSRPPTTATPSNIPAPNPSRAGVTPLPGGPIDRNRNRGGTP